MIRRKLLVKGWVPQRKGSPVFLVDDLYRPSVLTQQIAGGNELIGQGRQPRGEGPQPLTLESDLHHRLRLRDWGRCREGCKASPQPSLLAEGGLEASAFRLTDWNISVIHCNALGDTGHIAEV